MSEASKSCSNCANLMCWLDESGLLHRCKKLDRDRSRAIFDKCSVDDITEMQVVSCENYVRRVCTCGSTQDVSWSVKLHRHVCYDCFLRQRGHKYEIATSENVQDDNVKLL